MIRYEKVEKQKDEIFEIDFRIEKMKEEKRKLIRKLIKKPPLAFIYVQFVERKSEYIKNKSEKIREEGKYYHDMAKDLYKVELNDLIGTKECFYVPFNMKSEFPEMY